MKDLLVTDIFPLYQELQSILPPLPSARPLLRALGMVDIQKLDVSDPLVKIHTEIFSSITREINYIKNNPNGNY